MDKHLKHAINLALHNIETGGTPYGAVVVCDDKVVGEGFNTIHTSFDVSGHAELIAIRQAQQNLQTNDLRGCTIYASGHPCPMCFGAIGFVGIRNIVYANTLEEAADVGMGLSLDIYQYLKGDQEAIHFDIRHVEVTDDMNPMKIYDKAIRSF